MLFVANTELSRDDLTLTLRNLEGYLQDARSVRYTVFSWDGQQVSGRLLKATRQNTGKYYAPWKTSTRTGSYKVSWEIINDLGEQEFITENIFIVNKSDYVCGPNGLNPSVIPPPGSYSFISGSGLGPGDLPLYLKDANGIPVSAYAIFWTIFDKHGRCLSARTPGTQFAIGEYYSAWVANVPSGDYRILWEYAAAADSPLESKTLDFSVVCPSNPIPIDDCACVSLSYAYNCGSCTYPAPIRCIDVPASICSVSVSMPAPSSACCDIEIPRIVHLASSALPPGGAFTEQPLFPIPNRVRKVTFYVTYTRGAVGGYAAFRLLWGNGYEENQETALNNALTVVSTQLVSQGMSLLDYVGPTPVSDDPVSFVLYAEIPGGAKSVRLKAAERGAVGMPGSVGITLTASS